MSYVRLIYTLCQRVWLSPIHAKETFQRGRFIFIDNLVYWFYDLIFYCETFKSATGTLWTNKWLLNLLSANITKWSNTLKQFVGNLPTNFLSVFDHFGILALKGLRTLMFFCDMKLEFFSKTWIFLLI